MSDNEEKGCWIDSKIPKDYSNGEYEITDKEILKEWIPISSVGFSSLSWKIFWNIENNQPYIEIREAHSTPLGKVSFSFPSECKKIKIKKLGESEERIVNGNYCELLSGKYTEINAYYNSYYFIKNGSFNNKVLMINPEITPSQQSFLYNIEDKIKSPLTNKYYYYNNENLEQPTFNSQSISNFFFSQEESEKKNLFSPPIIFPLIFKETGNFYENLNENFSASLCNYIGNNFNIFITNNILKIQYGNNSPIEIISRYENDFLFLVLQSRGGSGQDIGDVYTHDLILNNSVLKKDDYTNCGKGGCSGGFCIIGLFIKNKIFRISTDNGTISISSEENKLIQITPGTTTNIGTVTEFNNFKKYGFIIFKKDGQEGGTGQKVKNTSVNFVVGESFSCDIQNSRQQRSLNNEPTNYIDYVLKGINTSGNTLYPSNKGSQYNTEGGIGGLTYLTSFNNNKYNGYGYGGCGSQIYGDAVWATTFHWLSGHNDNSGIDGGPAGIWILKTE